MPEISQIEEWSDTVESRFATTESNFTSQASWNTAQQSWNSGIESQIAALSSSSGGGSTTATAGGGILQFASSSAAPDVKVRVKNAGGIVCTGINDNTTINNAVAATGNQFTTKSGQKNKQYGSFLLSEGMFGCSGPLIVRSRGQAIYGSGPATVLYPCVSASNFATTGAAGAEKALIMVGTDIVAQNASMCRIENLSIDCLQWGTSAALSGIAVALTTVPEFGSTAPVTYGLPIPTNKNDQNWYITDVHVYGCKYGIYWTDTNGARDFFIRDCHIGAVSKVGIYAGASDSQIQGCQVITTTAIGGIGIELAGGNSKLWNSKVSYVETGVKTSSSRPTVNGVEAQDCTYGFNFNGSDDVKSSGCTVDTQEAGQYGVNLVGCDRMSIGDLCVHTRGTGTLKTGIDLPSGAESGTLVASVGATGITTQVAKGGVAVTASSQLPKGMINMISRAGVGNLFSAGTVA